MPAMSDASGGAATHDELELADWRRRVARLYADVRFLYPDDPVAAWQLWRTERESLFRGHPQSPVPFADRPGFHGRYWGYDARLAFELEVRPDEPSAAPSPVGLDPGRARPMTGLALALPTSGGGTMAFRRIGWLDVPFPDGARRLALYWMEGYAGGLFLPFRDATNGAETYGAGRYLLDAAKSADLGGDSVRRTLVCDFNFSLPAVVRVRSEVGLPARPAREPARHPRPRQANGSPDGRRARAADQDDGPIRDRGPDDLPAAARRRRASCTCNHPSRLPENMRFFTPPRRPEESLLWSRDIRFVNRLAQRRARRPAARTRVGDLPHRAGQTS